MPFRNHALLLGCTLVALSATPLVAQLPATRLASIVPLNGSPGQEVEVTINGSDLDGVSKLHFTHPGLTAKQKMLPPGPFDSQPQPAEGKFVVSIAGNVPAGRYDVRCEGKYGISNPRTFFVGSVPAAAEAEPNNSKEEATELEVPADVSGQFETAADVDVFRFTATGSQRVILDGYAYRADSAADLTATVCDAAGREIASSRDAYRGDPLLDFQTANGQTYTIKVHDAAYRGGPGYHYRFTIGTFPHIDYLFPPAAEAGGNRAFTIFGRNLPGGQNAGLSIDGRPLQKLAVRINLPGGASPAGNMFVEPAAGGIDGVAYQLAGKAGRSNAVVASIASAKPVVEKEPNNSPSQAQPLTIPCEAMGQFYPARDADWYTFDAAEGDQIAIEVISNRLGMGTNPNLVIEQVTPPGEGEAEPKITHVAYVAESQTEGSSPEFDTRSPDPVYRFTAQASGTYRLLVRDQKNALRADPRHIYRLAVRKASPDYRLAAIPLDSHHAFLLRRGGRVGVRVFAYRYGGFDGEITVNATGLPNGVTCEKAVIGPERNSAVLTLTANANAAIGSAKIAITGESQVEGRAVNRPARLATASGPLPPRQNNRPQPPADSRFASEIVLTVSEEVDPVNLAAGEAKTWETSRGGVLKIPYSRGGTFKGKLTLTASDLPANVDSGQLTINPNQNNGTHELKLKSNTPVGTYTFHLAGVAEQVEYTRNPEAAQAAAERKTEVDKIATDAAAAAKKAADEKAAADKAASDAKTRLDQATAEHAKAVDAVTKATTERDAAKTALDAATKAAAASPDDANLKNAVASAQKALTDAEAELKTAVAAADVAKKAVEEATAASEQAIELQAAATEAATAAAEQSKLATELKAATDKLATETANAAKPQKINVPVVSTPVTLKITPTPVEVQPIAANLMVKQGEKMEIPVKMQRKYDFKAAVSLQAISPGGISGLSITNAQVPANQAEGKFQVTAAANATPGKHEYTIRATMNFNGNNITIEVPMLVTVVEVEQEAK